MKHFPRFFQFSAVIVLLFAASQQLHAQRAPVGKIVGIVLDSATHAQIPNPTITFTKVQYTLPFDTIVVNGFSDGRFKKRLGRKHLWNMTVSAPGYKSVTIKEVNGNKNYKRVWIVVMLKKKE